MNITVIGAARSGLAAAMLARDLGHDVFLTESKPADSQQDAMQKLIDADIEFEFGENTEQCLEGCDLIIASPGVPPTADIIVEAEKRGINIISELEFAWQQIDNPVIAITGTNGKTTTTALTTFILNQSGKKAVSVGNIGTPLSAMVKDLSPETIIVAEVSSYQLDRIDQFQPDVAIILNITPDHIAYHGSLEKYSSAKFKISSRQSHKNLLVLNGDDTATHGGALNTSAQVVYFSRKPLDWGIYNDGGRMLVRLPGQHKAEEIMQFDDIALPGIHNAYNSMAAALAARAFEVRNENIRDSLMRFAGVEHRLEYVKTIDGVDYINDSKATNINASWFGLTSYTKPIIWIAGGRGDSNDYSKLDEIVKKNVKAIVSIGEESNAIFNHYSHVKRCIQADSLEDAVSQANKLAEYGDVVVFTPACKSFDMFMNFEHRGEVFKNIVNSL